MEKSRTIRQHKRKAALLLGLEYCDVNWLFLGLELGWEEGPPSWSLPGTEERDDPSGQKRPGRAMDSSVMSEVPP